ncbi:MAG: ABC transporter substrate-binding protein, partial [Betaproteobacteria bacterium]|nr:ABC transporter substrate-binding protein [Betaproteobacteria bacterium]
MSVIRKSAIALIPVIAALIPAVSQAQTREVKIYGFGAKSGVVRIFGLNSEAAMKAAANQIN